MESKKNNPILNFRLKNINEDIEDNQANSIADASNGVYNTAIYPAGSYITLTREAIDSTESAG